MTGIVGDLRYASRIQVVLYATRRMQRIRVLREERVADIV